MNSLLDACPVYGEGKQDDTKGSVEKLAQREKIGKYCLGAGHGVEVD